MATAAMLNANMPPSSHADAITSLAKRKRDYGMDVDIPNSANGINFNGASSSALSAEESQALIRDLIDVLKGHDTIPSILTRPISDQASSSGPQAKRQKPEESSEAQLSIMARLSSNMYNNVSDVLEDIDIAVSDIVDKFQLPNGAARNQYIPVSPAQSELSNKVTAFKQRAYELVSRELAMAGNKSTTGVNGTSKFASFSANNSLASTKLNADLKENKMVLTLYGNAPQAKQLFSSLQIPIKVAGENRKVLETLREAGLPNGISTTQIVPIQPATDDKKRVATLGELFPTPATVPALIPPKPSKIATTRGTAVGWYQPSTNESVARSVSYFKQSISHGQWLDYSNASGPSPQHSRVKPRDRALSVVGAKTSLVEEPAESDAAKLDALFRGAYSSFAPTKDDSAAVVPVGVLNRLWWQQVGEQSYGRMVENANPDYVENDRSLVKDEVEVIDINELEKLAADMEDYAIDPVLTEAKSAEEKDVDELLEDISDLLETLNSYQRNRHLSLGTASRPAGLFSTPDTSSLGAPSKPSDSEQATYEIIKSQLTLMIGSLPPYAVAKLDSDRLADLAISTKIEVQMNDYRGIMDEDEAAARAKVAALSAASSARAAAPASLNRSSSTALYGNQYATSRTAAPAANQYYTASQTPIRPPSNNMQRAPATAPVPYQSQRPAATTPYRPGPTYGTPSYPPQNPRPVQQQYSASTQPYMTTPSTQAQMRSGSQGYPMQQPAAQGYTNGRYASQTYQQQSQSQYQPQQHHHQHQPQTQSHNHPPHQQHLPQQHQPQHQPQHQAHHHQPQHHVQQHQGQPQQNGMGYQYGNGVNMHRQTSPQKPLYSPQPSIPQRPSYTAPAPAMQHNRQAYHQNASVGPTSLMNGSVAQTPQSQFAQQPSNVTNYSTFMTTAEQSSMMERQRAQLAAQTAQQAQARNAAQSAAISPSKAQVNGTNPLTAGL